MKHETYYPFTNLSGLKRQKCFKFHVSSFKTMPYYSKKIMKHFMHPSCMGKIKNADGIGSTENLRCGDIMRIYIKVEKKKAKEYIKAVKFETLGCGHAIAISDMICGLAKGKPLDKAKKIEFQDIVDDAGEVPQLKLHCIRLAETALKSAIKDYESKKKS